MIERRRGKAASIDARTAGPEDHVRMGVSLRWSEVDLERGYLRPGDSKTGAKVFPIGAPAIEVLASLPRLENASFVFPAASGGASFQGVDKVWRKVRVAGGFPSLRLHDLGHSFASAGLARGDALPVIGAILGHADVKTTSRLKFPTSCMRPLWVNRWEKSFL